VVNDAGSGCGCSAWPPSSATCARCRIFGIHPSTYYRWRGPVLGSRCSGEGTAAARGYPTRRASSPSNGSWPFPGHPGLGPRLISATLDQEH